MNINDDYTKRVVIQTNELPWLDSPAPGIQRRMLEREGDEIARATSVVRYAPNSSFPRHDHEQGEEFVVLDGVFSDGDGDYPTGTYVRNPPGSSHAPFTREGCVLFVKLRQWIDDSERARTIVDTSASSWIDIHGNGAEFIPLHKSSNTGELVTLHRWAPAASLAMNDSADGEEIFVLEGALQDESGNYEKGTWIRNPVGQKTCVRFTETGCQFYRKSGHLRSVNIR